MKTTSRLIAALTFTLAMLAGADAPGLTVTNFAPPFLTLNGSATTVSNGMRLQLAPAQPSQAGSAFLPVTLPADLTFSTTFQFQWSNAGGVAGAEGLAFVLEAAGASALGGPGAALGYGGIAPSLAVDFSSDNGNHVAFNTNGTINDFVAVSIPTSWDNSNVWYAWVDYTGSNGMLELRLAQTNTRPATATLSQTNLNLAALLGTRNVFAGFTGATGLGYNTLDVLAWAFTAPQPFLAQSITNFPALGNHATSDTVSLSAAASSGWPVNFSVASGPGLITGGNTLAFTGPGLVSVVAAQAGNADWEPAAALTNTCQVKNSQTITFAPIGTQIITNTLKLNATASSGLPVAFTVRSGPAVVSNGTNLTFTAHGWVSVVAAQGGDANNWAATPVTNSFQVLALYTLTVVSPLGTSIPSAGPNVLVEGTTLTPQGIQPPTITDGVITQYLCLGWTMTGNAPFAGNLSSFTMTVTNNATLTWLYTTNVYFHDDFEWGFGNWKHTGTWELDSSSCVSPTHCASSNPGAYYTNNTDTAMWMSNAISLKNMAHPALHFWTKYDLEDTYDFVYVEGSTNGGAAWFQIPGGSYTGTDAAWTEQQLDLAAWGTATTFQMRFHIVTDASVVAEGFFVDDVHIGDAPPALTAQPATTTPNSVTLSWTASNIGDFADYRIYRSMDSSGQPWQNGLLVGTLTGQDDTTFVDTTVAPKTHYYYQIVVADVGQLFAFSGVIPATTTIGMDYPFLDTGEAGGGDWVADKPWTLTTDDYVSPTHSWEDAPGANYPNGIAGQSLTLSSPMSFLAAMNPVLTFTHRYALGSGSYVNVEASTNQGAGWALLASYSGNSAGWVLGRVSLNNYAGQPAVLVRFRLTSSPGDTTDDWHIDNISATEGLATVNPVTLDSVEANSVGLAWPANTQGAFSYYAVYHDTNATVGINSPLAGIVTNQNTTNFTVTGLYPNTTHYFRVYAVNAYGGYSLDAPGAATTNTTLLTTPFFDNFEETALINFSTTGAWGLTAETSHSGLQCLASSPGTNYSPNGDDGALLQLNLTTNQWPVLQFWDRYATSPNARAAVEVNGNTSMYVVNGTQLDWQPERVDLSWWAGQPNLPVQFRLRRWNNEQDPGWYIDDVSVTEQVPIPLSYPFRDSFEQGLGNWLPATWHVVTNTQADGTNSVSALNADQSNVDNQDQMLSLAGWINLTNAVNPQLVFWWQGYTYWGLGVGVCTPGSGWTQLWNPGGTTVGQWTRVQISLATYIDQKIRLSFYGQGNASVYLDRVIVAEQTQPVTLTNAVAGFKSIQLNWTPTGASNSFVRYEVWRGTSSGQESWLTTITNVNQTSLTDSNGLPAASATAYYYRVYTVDTNDMYAASVNETNATTVQPDYPEPFSDTFSTLNQWITSGQWGLTTNTAYSEPSSLAAAPNGNYTANGDDNAQTSLDLRLAQWPVLRFWDSYALTPNARAAVQVAGTSMYVVNGTQAAWQPEVIDLSWWAGQDKVPLQFRLRRWNNEQAAGWYLDNVSVMEQVPIPLCYPFHDSFEQGLGNWLPATWHLVTNTQADGTNSVYALNADQSNVDNQDQMLSLAGWINLTNTANPQLVFWWQGYTYWGLGVGVCTPGSGWTQLWNPGGTTVGQWTRVQISLAAYINQKIRLSFYGQGNASVYLDRVIVAEQTQPVTLTNAVAGFKSIQLNWTPTGASNSFVRYEVWRGTSSGQESWLTTITNVNQTSLTDTNGLSVVSTYYYRVYTVDTNDMYVASVNETNATTTQLSYAFSDSFSTLNQWITFGQWGLTTNTAYSAPSSLATAPNGNYTANGDDNAQTALDLRLAQWPVLRFWDRYTVTPNARAAVEVGGTSMYNVNGTQAAWQPEAIDLSWWAGEANVPIEFRVRRWNNEQAAGWYVDDVSVTEQVPVPLNYPFFDSFEQGLGNWLPATWHLVTNTQADGTNSVYALNADQSNVDNQQPMLSLAGWINLTNAVNPQLVFWWQGYTYWGFGVGVCTPGGGWTQLWNPGGVTIGQWTRVQISLAAYINQNIRLSFYGSGNSAVYLDKVGVGGIMPGAPTLASPPNASLVTVRRPTLTVSNAVQAENLPLTYSFEVYADATLTNLVDQVPLVAAGNGTTSWPLDVNLADDARYWWRCRAWNGTNAGPWMSTAAFYVNTLGLPPLQVVLASPANASAIAGTNTTFSWYAGVDPSGDFIQLYNFQVDSDPAFGSPKVNGTLSMGGPVDPLSDVTISVPLGSYAGVQNLQTGVEYYWRVQAQDAHGQIGLWSSTWNFELSGVGPAPARATITSFRLVNGTNWKLQWSGPTSNVYLEASPSLSPATWSTVAGPLSGTSYNFQAPTNWPSGYYRLLSQ